MEIAIRYWPISYYEFISSRTGQAQATPAAKLASGSPSTSRIAAIFSSDRSNLLKRITIVALAVLLLATTTALAARVPVMEATRATAATTIDGKLEDDEAHHPLPSSGQPDTGRADAD